MTTTHCVQSDPRREFVPELDNAAASEVLLSDAEHMNVPQVMRVRCLPPKGCASGAENQVEASIQGISLATVTFWLDSSNQVYGQATGRTALLAFLPLAMKLGVDVVLVDPIDAFSLTNLNEWQHLMARWHPQSLRTVQVHAQHIQPTERAAAGPALRALMGFSGGVDSCHALWLHSARRQASALRVDAGLLVHGMDIPLSDEIGFSGARRRAQTMLESHGAMLLGVATDLRQLETDFKLDWEKHTHGITLAACLSLFESSFDALLIASTYPVDDLCLPWASNPISDSLLAGRQPLIHVGADSNKRQKVESFATDAVLTDHLRVCWEGSRGDANCGHCFKCLATQACLWLHGVPSPGAFDRPATLSGLRQLPIKNAMNHRLVADIHLAALRAGRIDLADALSHALRSGSWHRRRWLRLLGFKR